MRAPPVHPPYTTRADERAVSPPAGVDRGAALLNPPLAREASSVRVATELWRRRRIGSGGGSGCEGGMPPAEVFGAKMKEAGQGGREARARL